MTFPYAAMTKVNQLKTKLNFTHSLCLYNMMMKCTSSSDISDVSPTSADNEVNENFLNEPNSNVEEVITMTEMEHVYFCSDNLEYFPDDWIPSNNINGDKCLMGNTSLKSRLTLIDVLLDESPNKVLQLSARDLDYGTNQLTCNNSEQSIDSENNMPIAHAVNQLEYLQHLSDYDFPVAKHSLNSGAECNKNVAVGDQAFATTDVVLMHASSLYKLEGILFEDCTTEGDHCGIPMSLPAVDCDFLAAQMEPHNSVPTSNSTIGNATGGKCATLKYRQLRLASIPQSQQKEKSTRNEHHKKKSLLVHSRKCKPSHRRTNSQYGK
jgi:hypothetical protein